MVWIRGSKVAGSQSPTILTPDLVDPRDPSPHHSKHRSHATCEIGSVGDTCSNRQAHMLYMTCRPTWPADQPAHLANARLPGGPVRPWLLCLEMKFVCDSSTIVLVINVFVRVCVVGARLLCTQRSIICLQRSLDLCC